MLDTMKSDFTANGWRVTSPGLSVWVEGSWCQEGRFLGDDEFVCRRAEHSELADVLGWKYLLSRGAHVIRQGKVCTRDTILCSNWNACKRSRQVLLQHYLNSSAVRHKFPILRCLLLVDDGMLIFRLCLSLHRHRIHQLGQHLLKDFRLFCLLLLTFVQATGLS